MPTNLLGVFAAFLEPALHAWSNILDDHFSNKVFPKLSTLLFFGTTLNFAFLPIIFFVGGLPKNLPWELVPFVVAIGLINVLYLFPYYWSFRHADTSVVASLFAFGKILIPIFAFFFLGEKLLPAQYLGFGLIVLSATLLTLDIRKFRLNRVFFLMLGVSFALALQAIAYKYVFDAGATWSTVATALVFVEFFIAGSVMFATTKFAEIAGDFRKIKENFKLFVLQQGLEWGGYAGASYAISIIPVTVAQAIVGTQPLFVLAYAYAFRNRFEGFFNELMDPRTVAKKVVLFILIIIGTVLVVASGSTPDI